MGLRISGARLSDSYKKKQQSRFGGYDHRIGAEDGAIFHMENMSGDAYPLASSRRPRVISRTISKPNGIFGYDGLYYVDGTGFFDASVSTTVPRGTVTDTKKQFAFLGKLLIIMPDKAYYDVSDGTFGSLEATWSGAARFSDGTYMGVDASGCRIVTTGTAFPFKAGDAVSISGSSIASNNSSLIIREVSEDKKSLGFYENSFTVTEADEQITISRTVPDMDFIAENANRLWGCKGDTIYASALGDAFNFNAFDGLADDSFFVDVGSAGDFTVCCAYGGYMLFFKEECVYKVYGDKPTNFKAIPISSLGVMEGSGDSLAIAGGNLFFLSRAGMMIYTGAAPSSVAEAFGNVYYADAVGGSDGIRYYVSMRDMETGLWSLFCYDTRYRLWYREDSTEAVGFAMYDGLRMLSADGTMYRIGVHRHSEEGEVPEGEIASAAEFFDLTAGSPNHKTVNKVQLRVIIGEGASVTVKVSFDGGEYITVGVITEKAKASHYLAVPIHRCDYYNIRLEGLGKWVLCSLTREYSEGSEIR